MLTGAHDGIGLIRCAWRWSFQMLHRPQRACCNMYDDGDEGAQWTLVHRVLLRNNCSSLPRTEACSPTSKPTARHSEPVETGNPLTGFSGFAGAAQL